MVRGSTPRSFAVLVRFPPLNAPTVRIAGADERFTCRLTMVCKPSTICDPTTMGSSGGPITKDNTGVETYATVFTIAPSPKDGSVVWSGVSAELATNRELQHRYLGV